MRLQVNDPDGSVWRRGLRLAIVMPSVFAVALAVGAEEAAPFAAFSVVGSLGMADFGGPVRRRLTAYLVLTAVGAVYVALGTLCSQSVGTAVGAMAVVAFVTLLAGVFGGYVAGGTSAALLAFVLAVMTPGDPGSIAVREAGWLGGGLAAAAAAVALWPRHERRQLHRRAASLCRSVADLLTARSRGTAPDHDAEAQDLDSQVAALRLALVQTPYRPVGPSHHDQGLLQLTALAQRAADVAPSVAPGSAARSEAEADLLLHSAQAFSAIAATLEDDDLQPAEGLDPEGLDTRRARHRATLTELAAQGADGDADRALVAIDQMTTAFPLRILSTVAEQLGLLVDLLGGRGDRAPAGAPEPPSPADRARAILREHLHPRSAWLRNTLRGSIALAGSVAVAQLTNIDHAFWVVLATLSVLRSNATGTGTTAVQAVLGTVVGFGAATALLALTGGSATTLWILLPLTAFASMWFAGAVNLASGQAAFAVLVVVMFNIVEPVGWETGAIRVETVALGATVGVVAGLLFWPRGAEQAFRADEADRYRSARDYLVARAAAWRGTDPVEDPRDLRVRATDDAGRAAEAFTEFLAERGTKRVPWTTWGPVLQTPAAVVFAGDNLSDGRAGARKVASPALDAHVDAVLARLEHELTGAADTLGTPDTPDTPDTIDTPDEPSVSRSRSASPGSWDHLDRELDRELAGALARAAGDRAAVEAVLHVVWLAEWLRYLTAETVALDQALGDVAGADDARWWR